MMAVGVPGRKIGRIVGKEGWHNCLKGSWYYRGGASMLSHMLVPYSCSSIIHRKYTYINMVLAILP